MSDSVRPHRRQPTRLPRPSDSPSKNTGVGCHFLLQCMKVKSESEVAQSCPALSDPMDCSVTGSSVHGIFQAKLLEWCAIAFSGLIEQYLLTLWLKIPLIHELFSYFLDRHFFINSQSISLSLCILNNAKASCESIFTSVSELKLAKSQFLREDSQV